MYSVVIGSRGQRHWLPGSLAEWESHGYHHPYLCSLPMSTVAPAPPACPLINHPHHPFHPAAAGITQITNKNQTIWFIVVGCELKCMVLPLGVCCIIMLCCLRLLCVVEWLLPLRHGWVHILKVLENYCSVTAGGDTTHLHVSMPETQLCPLEVDRAWSRISLLG